MSARASLRERDFDFDPSVGTNAAKSSVIAVKFGNHDNDEPAVITESQLSAGYRSLMRDQTLAGRQASRNFRNGENTAVNSRLRMVKSLRQKESWLIWRDVVRDFERSFGAVLQRLSPSSWMRSAKVDEAGIDID